MKISDARKAYATLLVALRTEHGKRAALLKEPRKTIALAEMDRALDALMLFGDIVNMAVDAGLLDGEAPTVAPEQEMLIKMPRLDYP